MELVDDHVGKIRRHEIPVVPGKSVRGAHDAKAVRKVWRARVRARRVALVAAGALALDPEAIAVAVARAVLVSGPVAARILLQQTVVGELIENLSAKDAVQIDRARPPAPRPGRWRRRRPASRRSASAGKCALAKARPARVTKVSSHRKAFQHRHNYGLQASATLLSPAPDIKISLSRVDRTSTQMRDQANDSGRAGRNHRSLPPSPSTPSSRASPARRWCCCCTALRNRCIAGARRSNALSATRAIARLRRASAAIRRARGRIRAIPPTITSSG